MCPPKRLNYRCLSDLAILSVYTQNPSRNVSRIIQKHTGRAVTRIVASNATIRLTKAKVRMIDQALGPAFQVPSLLMLTTISPSVDLSMLMTMVTCRRI